MAAYPSSISLSTLNGTKGFRLSGIDTNDISGWSVASAGDVNGDGYDDVIVGAYQAGYAGEAYVIFGKASGWASSINLSTLDGKNGFALEAALNGHSSGKFGYSVSSAGDVNHDGYDDLLIGGPDEEVSSDDDDDAGAAFLVYGKASGWAAKVDLRDSTDTVDSLRFWAGNTTNLHMGRTVSSAGDVNGDGYDDMLISSYNGYGMAEHSGVTYLVFGGAADLSTFPAYPGYMSLSTLNGPNGTEILGTNEQDWAGYEVAAAGDINGDGYDDVILSTPNTDYLGTNSGSAYVIFGQRTSVWAESLLLSDLNGKTGFRMDGVGQKVASAGDINGDGFDDVVVSGSGTYVIFGRASGWTATVDPTKVANGTTGFEIVNAGVAQSFDALAGKGDFNGDGFDDILVGHFDASGTASASYLIFGSASGFSKTIDVSTLNGTKGITLTGAGFSVAFAGDVNKDGFDDVLVSDIHANSSAGQTYVVFGQAPTGSVTRTGSAIGQTIHGGSGNDTLIGKGGADKLIGGAGSDTASYAGAASGVTANLKSPSSNTGDAKGDTYSSIENLVGSSHGDRLTGNDGANTLSGGGGPDSLDGGAGIDTASYAGSAKSVVASLKMPSLNTNDAKGDSYFSIERLEGTSYNDILYGNDSSNRVSGGAGNDRIYGGLGKDTLYGGAGNDVFVFDTKLGSTNIDTLDGFYRPSDKIRLDNDIFTKVGKVGTLELDDFYIGAKAHDSSDRIIYDKATGTLYYDDDGSGSHQAVEFAIIDKALSLTAASFDIIG